MTIAVIEKSFFFVADNLKGVNIASSTNVESDRRKLNGILYWLEPVTV